MKTSMKVGMVGLDTSHVVAFTTILNDSTYEYHLPGVEVVGAYPGGSDIFSLSRNRVKGFTDDLKGKYGMTLYDSIERLAEEVDAIFLESSDGRQHIEQFRRMAVGKPVFIDKPFATSTADAREIITLANENGTPIMSCSSLRYAAGISDLVSKDERVVSCEAFGPASILEDYPGLFWYGIHAAEVLFTFMGAGCKEVRCIAHKDLDVVVGEWDDGRIGILKGTRLERSDFGCVVHTNTATRLNLARATPPYYFFMLQKVTEFFKTGVSPIDIQETFDIIAFLEAADRSRELGGKAVQSVRLQPAS
jgi:predicted dehydrogenase